MTFILKPTGNAGLTGAIEIPETALPQTVSTIAAGSYDIARLAWSANPIIVTDPVVNSATFFTAVTDSLPSTYFVDPNPLGANVTRLRRLIKMRLASYPSSAYDTVFGQQTAFSDLMLSSQGGGTGALWTIFQKDSAGNNMFATSPYVTGVAVPALGVMFTAEHDVDMIARTVTLKINDVIVWTGSFTVVPTTNFFANASNRRLLYLSSQSTGGSGVINAGAEIEYIRTYKTIAGVETLHNEETGPAANVNANPNGWKQGGLAA